MTQEQIAAEARRIASLYRDDSGIHGVEESHASDIESLVRKAVEERDAEIERLRGALDTITRTPTMPFPDRGAHSERAFREAVWNAWSRIQLHARAALATQEPPK